MNKSEYVTQDMLDAIPEEWKREIESKPKNICNGLSDEMIKKIDTMLLLYYPEKSYTSIAQVMGITKHHVTKRGNELKRQGKL